MASAKAKLKQLEHEQNKAADEVCWTLILMMAFGGLDLPDDERQFLGKRMEEWSDISDKHEALLASSD
jgi:hypothetical protein